MNTEFVNFDGSVTEFPAHHGLFYAFKKDLSKWYPFTGMEENFRRDEIRVESFIKNTLYTEHSGFICQ